MNKIIHEHWRGWAAIVYLFLCLVDFFIAPLMWNIEKCHFLYGVQEIYMPKIDAYDRVVRCPLDENVFWFGVI